MYECAECGAEVIVADGGATRSCDHSAPIVAHASAHAAGASRVL